MDWFVMLHVCSGRFLTFSRVYIASLIKIIPAVVYAASVVIGIGAALLWVAQGAFLTKCSDDETRGRNSGLFWGMFQLSLVDPFLFAELTSVESWETWEHFSF